MSEPKETHGKYIINGKEYGILGYVSTQGENVPKETPGAAPLLDIKMMSDFKWQYLCLMSRIEHPENYKNSDIAKSIDRIKRWLIDHIECIGDLNPADQQRLLSVLNAVAA